MTGAAGTGDARRPPAGAEPAAPSNPPAGAPSEAGRSGSQRSADQEPAPARSGGLRLLVGAGLALLGMGGWLAAGALDTPLEVAGVSPNLPVNASAVDPGDLTAHNSPTLARDPTDPSRLAVANRIDSPTFSCALHVSTDGGDSWRQIPIPAPRGAEACYAPDVAFGPEGTLYLSFVTLTGRANTPDAVWISRSGDGGTTLSGPVRVSGPLAFQVRVAADPQQPGRLWLTWLQAEEVAVGAFPATDYPIVAAGSTDGGRTWSEAVRVSDPSRERVLAPTPLATGAGRLAVAYLDLGGDRLDYHGAHRGRAGPPYDGVWRLVVARSADAGGTFQEATVDEVVPTERFVPFLPPFPVLAGDGRRLYAAFHGGRLGDADIWLWWSPDAGATWSQAVRVNDTPEGDGTTQRLPALATGPEGRLDVAYYDRRADPEDTMTTVSLRSSPDGGASFLPHVTLADRVFDSRVGVGSERGMADLGSRLGLVSGPSRATAVWTDTRAGTPASKKQDLVRASVRFATPTHLPPPVPVLLRIGAVMAVGAGALVAARGPRARPGGDRGPATGDHPRTAREG